MKKLTIVASIATIAISLSAGVQAASAISTEELMSYCKSTDSSSFVTCEIYGQAVYDTYLVTRHPKFAPNTICVKQPAQPRKEVIQEYIAWSDANPKLAKLPAAETILRFLSTKFPCGKAAK
jgi:hypothetical protein